MLRPWLEHGAEDLGDILGVPSEGHFLALGLVRDFLKGFSSDKIMVELDEGPVAEFVRRQIVVFDVIGIETAANGTCALVTPRGQPLPVSLHLFACIDGRKG